MNAGRTLYHAAMVADGRRIAARPGAILVEGRCVIAAGEPAEIGCDGTAQRIDLGDRLLVPALVNAHAHLDLTHIGPRAYTGDFTRWVDLIRAERATDEDAIAASVQRGVELARRGGTAAVGDIAGIGSCAAADALRASGMGGVSYIEVFGIGRRASRAIERLRSIFPIDDESHHGVRLGIQPHAPYSCARSVYEAAAALGRPLATHLAETREELRFARDGGGPLAAMLQRIGVWDETVTGLGGHPVEALDAIFRERPLIAAHLNYIDDEHIERLAAWRVTIAYCPRASAYFGHAGHRYRDMLDAGINVALGTDSLVCLDTPDWISILDEMRLLSARDGADSISLLRMATINGARGLGLAEEEFTFEPGPVAGILALPIDPADAREPLHQALRRADPPEWIVGPVSGEALTVVSAGGGLRHA